MPHCLSTVPLKGKLPVSSCFWQDESSARKMSLNQQDLEINHGFNKNNIISLVLIGYKMIIANNRACKLAPFGAAFSLLWWAKSYLSYNFHKSM